MKKVNLTNNEIHIIQYALNEYYWNAEDSEIKLIKSIKSKITQME